MNLGERRLHRIAQHANASDSDFYDIAVHDGADTGRGAGGDEIAGLESHHAGNPAHDKRRRKKHQRGATRLAGAAVDKSLDLKISRIEFRFDVRADRAKGVKTLRA